MKFINSGFNVQEPPDFSLSRPSGLRNYTLLIIRSPAYFVLKDTLYKTKGNAIVLYSKNSPQLYGADGVPFLNDWIQFDADTTDLVFFAQIGLPLDTLVEFQDLKALMRFIKQLSTKKEQGKKNVINSIFMPLLLFYMDIPDYYTDESSFSATLDDQLITLRNNIYATPYQDWSLERISQSIAISISYLLHRYKALFHTTIKQDITTSRLEHSKYLLTHTTLSVADVSRRVGYENDVHFMRVFKKETGLTPSQYRKSQTS